MPGDRASSGAAAGPPQGISSALHPRLSRLRAALSRRLTAALVGLLRAFT
ncbi:MAG TPA: hypothetical protein VGX23_00030 [Actinocrinis sp.]|nr:hypothetical protein [Actinocrinis sp.]